MAVKTKEQIKTEIDTNITTSSSPRSITHGEVGEILDDMVDSLLEEGEGANIQAAQAAAVAAQEAAEAAEDDASEASTTAAAANTTATAAQLEAAAAETAATNAQAAASTAQGAADVAQADIDEHEANHPTSGLDTDAVDARIADYARIAPSGQIADAQIPSSIMRDMEFSAAAVRGLLGLTEQEVNGLFVGAAVSSSTLTFTMNDGTTLPLTVSGGGMVVADGHVDTATLDPQTGILTLHINESDETVTADLSALLNATANSNNR